MKTCSKCRYRYRSHSCPQCRTNERTVQRGGQVAPCLKCGVAAPLRANQECRRCLASQGLRECDTCHKILRYNLDFYSHRSSCKTCSGKTSTPRLAKYGITQDEYAACVEAQEGRCAICNDEVPLVIDHDHRTLHFRGLLCRRCNVGVGYFRDSKRYLERAIQYLDKAKTRDDVSPGLPKGQAAELVRLHKTYGQEIESLRQYSRQTIERLETNSANLEEVRVWLAGLRAFLRHPGPENPEVRLQLANALQARLDALERS